MKAILTNILSTSYVKVLLCLIVLCLSTSLCNAQNQQYFSQEEYLIVHTNSELTIQDRVPRETLIDISDTLITLHHMNFGDTMVYDKKFKIYQLYKNRVTEIYYEEPTQRSDKNPLPPLVFKLENNKMYVYYVDDNNTLVGPLVVYNLEKIILLNR